MSGPRIRLVTRGDDAGSCPSADRAILEAFRNGLLRNVSVMVPGPTFRQAAETIKGAPGLCVGLHVTLNAEWDSPRWGPVLPSRKVRSLVDEKGLFCNSPTVLHQRNADGDEMIAEVKAQLDQARACGLEVAYLDEHMGIGWVGGLQQRLADLCRREGLIESHAAVRGLPRVEGKFADPVDDLIARLAGASPGTYLYVTHPGYDAEDMRQFVHQGLEPGQVARQRDADRRLWTDPRLIDCCREHGVQAIRYTDINDRGRVGARKPPT